MRILIATGGSPHSNLAIQLGGTVAKFVGTTPTILTIVKNRSADEIAVKRLQQVQTHLPAGLEEPITKIRYGEPATEIINEAREGNYELIVLGERSQHRLLSRLLSPTSEKVIAQAHCPVLIAKASTTDFSRILVCDSGVAEDPLLERFTSRLPELLTPETDVTVLHVMSQISAAPGVRGWELRADAESLMKAHTPEGEWLEHDMEILQESPAQSQPKIRHGKVVDEILAEAACADYDLVVIGAHRTEGWQRILLDDIARQIIRDVKRPVLVLQQPRRSSH
jgi:nucleotide-binding universal stress UspA family protein